MSNWKDTVMSEEQTVNLFEREFGGIFPRTKAEFVDFMITGMNIIKNIQADISFPAGSKNVAGRIGEMLWEYHDRLVIHPEDVIKEIETFVHQIMNDDQP